MRAAGAIAIGVFVGLSGLAAATQVLAAIFAYQPALGRPIARIDGAGVYWPWSVVTWSAAWRASYPRPFALADFIMAATAAAGCLSAAIVLARGARAPPWGWRLGAFLRRQVCGPACLLRRGAWQIRRRDSRL